MTLARQSLGRAAEELVARRLEAAGARVLARNARIREPELSGELDIIAIERATLVFVEVKAATEGRGTGPERAVLAVGRRKRARLRRLAALWLAGRWDLPPFRALRFDVVGVSFDRDGAVADYEHVRGAL